MRHLRRVKAWSFVAALVLVVQLMPANSLAAGGSISGSVEDLGGSAIRNICVGIVDAVTGIRVQRTLTDADGMYAADDLSPGNYKVLFRDCVAPLDFASEWNDNVRDESLATPVTVAVDQITQVNAALDRWGALTGSVEDVGGSAIRDICVRVFDDLGRGAGWARTDANGMYTLKIRSLLGTGSYRVRFYDCLGPDDYAPEWNDNALLPGQATPVTVTVGHDTEVNAALDRWGTITGKVEDVGGSAIRDICVRAAGADRGWTRTDANGMYALKIRSIRTRGYLVRFSDCIGPDDYAPEWNDNAPIRKHATPVTVTVGHDTEVNAALDRWGAISGTITDEATGHALADICVRVFPHRGSGVGWTRTGADGRYTVKIRTRPPETGSFKVHFSDCLDHRGYIPEFYDNIPNRRQATELTVEIGQTTSGIDAALGKFGGISGRVTDDVTTEPIADACVSVFDESRVHPVGSVRTGADGTYTVGGLYSGTYKVRFRDCDAPIDYNVLWYRDSENFRNADPVDVTVGSVIGNINVALVPNKAFTLSVGKVGSGSGTVTSHPVGIQCGADCTQDYLKGTHVTLTAFADLGSIFVGWSGSCSGTGLQTNVTMDASKTCTAEFSGSPPPPSISSFSPLSGPVGTSVTIAGAGFSGASVVSFNGVLQPSFTVNPTGTLITAAVPLGASTGPIHVTTPSGTATSLSSFAVTAGAHERTITLSLRWHLVAEGNVVVTDGFVACFQNVRVNIQRRISDHWRTVATDQTGADGSFRDRLPNRTGWYRARVNEVTLTTGDVCNGATSGIRHQRAS